MKPFGTSLGWLLVLLLTSSCASPPKGVEPITNFDVNRYLGTWYEIARLDHRFERNLDFVTADYSLREDGMIKVLNQGYDKRKKSWSSAVGKAKFNGEKNVGSLAVSFFGPFYGGYFITELDKDYQYVLIAGPNRNYLWILARTPTLDPAIYDSLVAKARTLGFPTDGLIKVDQANPPARP